MVNFQHVGEKADEDPLDIHDLSEKEWRILRDVLAHPMETHQELARQSGYSPGYIPKTLKRVTKDQLREFQQELKKTTDVELTPPEDRWEPDNTISIVGEMPMRVKVSAPLDSLEEATEVLLERAQKELERKEKAQRMTADERQAKEEVKRELGEEDEGLDFGVSVGADVDSL